jgi:hypothetical protein
MSLHSLFSTGLYGHLKMQAIMQAIQNSVSGPITILLADRAHLHTFSLNYAGDLDKALAASAETAKDFVARYHALFTGCQIVSWNQDIYGDEGFSRATSLVTELYESDPHYRMLIWQDSEASYTPERSIAFPEKGLFLEKARLDLLEQCASLIVLAKQGYRYLFYPGPANIAIDYFEKRLALQIPWIHLFIAIEKLTKQYSKTFVLEY